MSGDLPAEFLVTVTFEKHEGKTKMTLKHASGYIVLLAGVDILRCSFYSSVLCSILFLKKDLELLERRMRMREKEEKQKTIVKFAAIIFLIELRMGRG